MTESTRRKKEGGKWRRDMHLYIEKKKKKNKRGGGEWTALTCSERARGRQGAESPRGSREVVLGSAFVRC